MQALRLHEVLSRVVAWHNRHPLARRISASQVHSIGEVLLPFASAEALATGEAATPAPTQADTDRPPELPAWRPRAAPAPAPADAPAPAVHAVDAQAPATDGHPPSAPATDAVDEDEDDDAELEIDIDLLATDNAPPAASGAASGAGDGEALQAMQSQDEPGPAPTTPEPGEPSPADPFDLPELQDEAAPSRSTAELSDTGTAQLPTGPSGAHADDALYPPASAASTLSSADHAAAPLRAADIDTSPAPQPERGLPRAEAASAGITPRPTGLRRLLLALRTALTGRQPGMPRLQAAFSRDFIWPLTPAQVARWAQRHGQVQPLAPADWPRRRVDTEPQRLAKARQKGLAHTVQLHVLTAAIGVGDRRIRVLMDAQGAVIGPRSYSRPRVAAATGVLMAGVLGVGGSLWWPAHEAGADTSALAALAASAPAAAVAVAAASASAAVAASAADEVHVAALVLPPAASAALVLPPAESAAQAHPVAPASAPSTPTPASPSTLATPAAHPPEAHAAADPQAPAGSEPAQPVARIRPTLSAEERQLARLQGERLRASPPAAAPAPAPVYAVVTRPSRQRESATQGLALMRDSSRRLPPPLPDHGELMHNQGEWRAAWWPFASLADAERARVMLASRGLKADVVEY